MSAALFHTQSMCYGRAHQIGVTDRGQGYEDDSVRKRVAHLYGRLDREARLADAWRSHEREEADVFAGDLPADGRNFLLAPKERRGGSRQIQHLAAEGPPGGVFIGGDTRLLGTGESHEIGVFIGRDAEARRKQFGDLLRRAALTGLEFLDEHQRAANAPGELILCEVLILSGVLEPGTEGYFHGHKCVKWAGTREPELYGFL